MPKGNLRIEGKKTLKNEIILFETEDKSITLPVQVTADTVWLNRNQLAELFGRDIKTIGKHIGNALKEELEESEVVAKFATTTRDGMLPVPPKEGLHYSAV